jgi:hypothetical protein
VKERDFLGFLVVVGELGRLGGEKSCDAFGCVGGCAGDEIVFGWWLLGPELVRRNRLWLLLFRRDLNIPHHAAIRNDAAAAAVAAVGEPSRWWIGSREVIGLWSEGERKELA